MNEDLFPKVQKSISNYLTDEEGNVTRNKIVTVGAMMLIMGLVFALDVFAKHRSHLAHRSHSQGGHRSHYSSYGGHSNHSSHSDHGSHSNTTTTTRPSQNNGSNHISHISHGSHASTTTTKPAAPDVDVIELPGATQPTPNVAIDPAPSFTVGAAGTTPAIHVDGQSE